MAAPVRAERGGSWLGSGVVEQRVLQDGVVPAPRDMWGIATQWVRIWRSLRRHAGGGGKVAAQISLATGAVSMRGWRAPGQAMALKRQGRAIPASGTAPLSGRAMGASGPASWGFRCSCFVLFGGWWSSAAFGLACFYSWAGAHVRQSREGGRAEYPALCWVLGVAWDETFGLAPDIDGLSPGRGLHRRRSVCSGQGSREAVPWACGR